ncbi:17775_t:CDS:1, partial [Gigaspora margarita]
ELVSNSYEQCSHKDAVSKKYVYKKQNNNIKETTSLFTCKKKST